MSSVETGQMSAVETGQMSAAETGQMSAVETRQMSTTETGLCPVPIFYISVLFQQQTSVLSQQRRHLPSEPALVCVWCLRPIQDNNLTLREF